MGVLGPAVLILRELFVQLVSLEQVDGLSEKTVKHVKLSEERTFVATKIVNIKSVAGLVSI